MFDWFWEFLYGISKTLLRLIDTILYCANVLVGITPMTIDGEEQNFLVYLITSDSVDFAFKACAVLGFIAVILFSIIAIIKSFAKDGKDGTPAQIGVKAFKAIIMFVAVPLLMIVFIILGNAFMTAIYKASAQGSNTLGSFLFVEFASDGAYASFQDVKDQFLAYNEFTGTGLSYYDTDAVARYVDLSDYNYILSWIVSIMLLYVIGTTFLVFIERIISIVLLYILAPFSVSSTVLDDGARFKLWRDQVLVKFFSGYGTILALNIYCMVMGLISSDGVKFFSSDFPNFITKVIIIIGGGLSLKKSMSIVGNLIQSGAGTGEMSGPLSAGGIVGSMMGIATTVTGLHLTKDIISSGWQSAKRKAGEAVFGLDKAGGGAGGGNGNNNNNNNNENNNDNQNNNNPNYQNDDNNVRNELENNNENNNNENNDNHNDNNVNQQNDNPIADAINDVDDNNDNNDNNINNQ